MCNSACIQFGHSSLYPEEIKNKTILEVGSYNVNGSLREYIETYKPASYIGVDIQPGPGVDQVCDAINLLNHFGTEAFDILISTEMLEHGRDWRVIITNFKKILKPSGILLITTRSKGFPYHDYPSDYWRFELEDMQEIFADFQIELLESDPSEPGVFLKAIKPIEFTEKNLATYQLYSSLEAEFTRIKLENEELKKEANTNKSEYKVKLQFISGQNEELNQAIRLADENNQNLKAGYDELYKYTSHLEEQYQKLMSSYSRLQTDLNALRNTFSVKITSKLGASFKKISSKKKTSETASNIEVYQPVIDQEASFPQQAIEKSQLELPFADLQQELPYERTLYDAGKEGRVLHRENIYGFGPPQTEPSIEIIDIIQKNSSPPLLDVGCGIGTNITELEKRNYPSCGIEVNKEYVNKAQLLERKVSLYDGFKIPYPDNHFSTVTAIEVLEHIETWEQTLGEMIRVSKSTIIFTVPDIGVLPRISKHGVVPWHLLESTHLNFFSPEILTTYLSNLPKVSFKIMPFGEYQVNGEAFYMQILVILTKNIQS